MYVVATQVADDTVEQMIINGFRQSSPCSTREWLFGWWIWSQWTNCDGIWYIHPCINTAISFCMSCFTCVLVYTWESPHFSRLAIEKQILPRRLRKVEAIEKCCLQVKWFHIYFGQPFVQELSHLATIDRKMGAVPLLGGAGSPSSTMSPGLRPTSVPSDILMHPAV